MARIETAVDLRALYGEPGERSVKKVLDRLDLHCRRYIALSPFVLISSQGADGLGDVTPRGDHPGFVAVENDRSLLMPDRPGNNRLDALMNILANPSVGMLFMVPGIDETLRVSGRAEIRTDPSLLAQFEMAGKLPKSVLRIAVAEAYLHCAKALMRSRLWDPAARVERSTLPSLGEMIKDQINWPTAETQTEMIARFEKTPY